MRAVIYTRVSSEEQVDGYSLSAQKRACRQFAEQRGWDVGHIYEEQGRSAKNARRPVFMQLMRDAEANLFDVLIVHKLDRFSRNIADTMTYLKRLDERGVAFVSATEAFDLTTPAGKMMLMMLAVFAEWYLDNLSQETSKGKRERARKGGWNGTLPFGYTTVKRLRKQMVDLQAAVNQGEIDMDKLAEWMPLLEAAVARYERRVGENDAIPCPINAPAVVLAYEKYSLDTYSDLDIADILNNAGYRTTGTWGNNLFSKDTIRPLLQNRFYLGETSYRGKKRGTAKQIIDGIHEPLISPELFDKCQRVRAARAGKRRIRSSSRKEKYPLSRMLRCLDCGSAYRGWTLRGQRRYRDTARDHGLDCPTRVRSIAADELEQQATGILLGLELPPDWRDRAIELLQQQRPGRQAATTTRHSVHKRLERLKMLFVMGDLTEAEYRTQRDDFQQQIEALPVPIQSQVFDLERIVEHLDNLHGLWDVATLGEREQWFRMIFVEIYIASGAIKAVKPTDALWALLDTLGGSDGI